MSANQRPKKSPWINLDQRRGEAFRGLSEKYEPSTLDWLIGISPEHKFVHFDNPKVASGTLKKTIAKTIDPAFDPLETNIHSKEGMPLVCPNYLNDADLEYFLTSAEIFRWVFVRHPTTRVLSAFLNKLVDELPAQIQNASIKVIDGKTKSQRVKALGYIETRKAILKILGRDPDGWGSDITFEDFIDCLERVDLSKTNPHWRPQTMLIPFDILDIEVFRFENLDEDLAHVLARIGGQKIHIERRYATEASSKVRQYVTPGLEERIYALYKNDYEVLGYEPLLIS